MSGKPEMLSASAIRRRGWSDAMIRDLLGEPDELRANPMYRSRAPMRLYLLNRVQEAEDGESFADRRAARDERSAKSKNAADRRSAGLAEWARTVPISVDWPKSLEAATKLAVAAQQEHYDRRSLERGYYDGDHADSADSATKTRWVFNFIRHERTRYDGLLWHEVKGKPGAESAHDILRDRIDSMIAQRYNLTAPNWRGHRMGVLAG